MEKQYVFTVYLSGDGETVEEAWRDACEGFMQDCGDTPEDYTVHEIEEDEA